MGLLSLKCSSSQLEIELNDGLRIQLGDKLLLYDEKNIKFHPFVKINAHSAV